MSATGNSRSDTIKVIRTALRRRSGKPWSVRGGRGTAWGWITICSPPTRMPESGSRMFPEEAAQLGELLGLDGPAHPQGVSIPDGSDFYQEYVDRAEGRAPTVTGTPYWD